MADELREREQALRSLLAQPLRTRVAAVTVLVLAAAVYPVIHARRLETVEVLRPTDTTPHLSSTAPKPAEIAVARYCARHTAAERRFFCGTRPTTRRRSAMAKGRYDDGHRKEHRWRRGSSGRVRGVAACRQAHDCVDPRHLPRRDGLVVAVLDSKASRQQTAATATDARRTKPCWRRAARHRRFQARTTRDPCRQVARGSSRSRLSSTGPNRARLQWGATELVPRKASDDSHWGTGPDAVAIPLP